MKSKRVLGYCLTFAIQTVLHFFLTWSSAFMLLPYVVEGTFIALFWSLSLFLYTG
jgi:hypothetical protein